MSLLLTGLLLVHGTDAVAQDESLTVFRSSAAEVTFGGRVQMQFNTSDADGAAPTEMMLRRVRLSVAVRMNEIVSGRLQPEFAGPRIQLADTHVQLRFSRALQVVAGRGQRPFGILEQTSSTMIIPIERGMAIRGVEDVDLYGVLSGLEYSNRDTGIQLVGAPRWAPLSANYALGVFGGPLQGSTGDAWTQQYVARIEISPAAHTSLGLAMSRRDFAPPAAPDEFDLRPGTAFVVDATYGGPTPRPGLHLMAELATGDYDPFRQAEFRGGHLWAAYRHPLPGTPDLLLEPLVRISRVTIADDAVGGTLFTPGINLYVGGLNRVMMNYDLWNPAVGPSASAFRAQFQLAF